MMSRYVVEFWGIWNLDEYNDYISSRYGHFWIASYRGWSAKLASNIADPEIPGLATSSKIHQCFYMREQAAGIQAYYGSGIGPNTFWMGNFVFHLYFALFRKQAIDCLIIKVLPSTSYTLVVPLLMIELV